MIFVATMVKRVCVCEFFFFFHLEHTKNEDVWRGKVNEGIMIERFVDKNESGDVMMWGGVGKNSLKGDWKKKFLSGLKNNAITYGDRVINY